MDIEALLKQAQAMQQKMQQMQEELGRRTVEGQSGGGMVTAVANGRQELVSIRIDPQAVDVQDVPMLEDLVVAAVNQALANAREMVTKEMSALTGGIQIPGLNI